MGKIHPDAAKTTFNSTGRKQKGTKTQLTLVKDNYIGVPHNYDIILFMYMDATI